MGYQVPPSYETKTRIIQELVPGKQVTLAHIIASPDEVIYEKLGLDTSVNYARASIGILSTTPGEISVIAGDLAIKTSDVQIGFIDRLNGTLIFTGTVSSVEEAIKAINQYLVEKLGFSSCEITRT